MTRADRIAREIKMALIESDVKAFIVTVTRLFERLDEIEIEIDKLREEIS